MLGLLTDVQLHWDRHRPLNFLLKGAPTHFCTSVTALIVAAKSKAV